jgi:hypothetical protein
MSNTIQRRSWSDEETRLVLDLRHGGGLQRKQVAKRLGRSLGSVIAKLDREQWGYGEVGARGYGAGQASVKPSAEALDDLDRRHAALNRRSLTASLLGDPPPGFSQLDKQRGASV